MSLSPSPAAGFRCAAESLLRDEPVAGTATHVRTWLLLEHVGPWGDDALRIVKGRTADIEAAPGSKPCIFQHPNRPCAQERKPKYYIWLSLGQRLHHSAEISSLKQ